MWNIESRELVKTYNKINFDTTEFGLQYGSIIKLCFSKDGNYLFFVYNYNYNGPNKPVPELYRINLENDSIIKCLELRRMIDIIYSPISDTLAVLTEGGDYQIFIVDANTFEIKNWFYTDQQIFDYTISPNGNYLATAGSDGNVKIWSMTDYSLYKTIQFDSNNYAIDYLKFNHSSNYLLTVGGGFGNRKTKVWDLSTNENLRIYPHSGNFDIAPDDSSIIFTELNKLIMIKAYWTPSGVSDNTNPDSPRIIRPNPTDGVTNIDIDITKYGEYSIKIIDGNGKEIDKIFNGELEPGQRNIKWDAGRLQGGMYFIIIQGKNYSETLKLVKE